MKKYTKVALFFIVVTVLPTAYAFASMLGVKVQPLPEPLSLLLSGCLMVVVGHSLRQVLRK